MTEAPLWRRLLDCHSEAEVTAIVEATPQMADPANWKNLDNRDTNNNTISNQSSDGGKALTELITNMVDAVLMKHVERAGVDPRGAEAPQTMYEAVERHIDSGTPIRDGRLRNLDHSSPWLRDFALGNLVIGITGARSQEQGRPCYTFVDNGEGQHPQSFPDTFLSLSAGTKRSIPFVQGQFNMGSSGVLPYCGACWYKLIISRRHDKSGDWGWTLIRRRPDDLDVLPVAEYFAPNGRVPSFSLGELRPLQTQDGSEYERVKLQSGTVIKLYDYQMSRRHLSFRGAREALNENLVETILPLRLLDFRQKRDAKRGGDRALGIDARPFYGMEFLLINSHKEPDREENEEEDEAAAADDSIPVGQIEDPELGIISISAIPLKREEEQPAWLKGSNNRVFHVVNGQVQYKQTKGFLGQCRLHALQTRVVLIVDASQLAVAARNDIWKADRERIRSTARGERYEEKVKEVIKNSESLKELQQKVAKEMLESVTKDENKDLFQAVVDRVPGLTDLLTDREPDLNVKGQQDIQQEQETPELTASPENLELDKRVAKNGIDIPLGSTRRVELTTDAEDAFLKQGRVVIPKEGPGHKKGLGHDAELHGGRLRIRFTATKGYLRSGDEFSFKIRLEGDGIAVETKDELKIRVVDEVKKGTGKKKRKLEKQEEPAKAELPKYEVLTKDGRTVEGYEGETKPWTSVAIEGFDEKDGGTVDAVGERERIYKINYDNIHLQAFLKKHAGPRGAVTRAVTVKRYIFGMLVLMVGFESALEAMKKTLPDGGEGDPEAIFRRFAAQGAAKVVLSLAEALPKIEDKTVGQEDDEDA